MNNLAHWQDDMDEALVGDFDGSLSGLCIMSLSFDFTPNGTGPHHGTSRDTTTANNHQPTPGLFDSGTATRNKSINYSLNINHDVHNDNSNNCFNYFKRFKPSITNEANHDDETRSNNQNKIARQLQQIKNCLNTTNLNTNTNNHANSVSANSSNNNPVNNCSNAIATIANQIPNNSTKELSAGRSSPHSSETSCNRNSVTSTPDESSRSSTIGARSPSPSTSKQKFQYVLAEPISVATKLTEDTITYLNQGQAYEIKLENITDVAEAKKGFMCSIINIGFYERHMQQAENELWQQWGQQHPNEKIFSVDMKLSYNVFGVEWDGLSKYEFLWDSSKAAGVFIRVNSISTEFTPKKHGGEKGVPFKLSIETFSYNSKTHDSYFISAACCQIKVFKPKGAERKIRSDRDKISKRPLSEQEKYHKSCERTTFKECSLASLHPMADDSLCYYRHSHGHFASKQVISSTNINGTPSAQVQQASSHHSDEGIDHGNNGSHHNQSTENRNSQDSDANQPVQQREYQNHVNLRNQPIADKMDYSINRLSNNNQYGKSSNLESSDDHHAEHSYGTLNASHDNNHNQSNELLPFQQPNAFNQMYHGNQMRSVASLASINNSQHFGMAYYSHTLPPPIAPHIPPSASYGVPTTNSLSTISHTSHGTHNFHMQSQQHMGAKGTSSMYRNLNHDKALVPITTPHGTSFKASNLAITSHNNFPTYLNNHSDHCDSAIQEAKDANSNNVNYHHESYEPNQNHPNSHCQQPFRQRSTSLTTMNAHCSGYTNHSRNFENYIGSNNNMSDNSSNNNNWMNSHTNNSQPTSLNALCPQRSNSDIINHSSEPNSYNSDNYDCNNDNYDSDQNSPQKNHQHASESSSSCYSRYKNNSSIVPCIDQQDHVDNSRTNSTSSHISINSNCVEVVSWFTANRFGLLTKTFSNFCGSDLLRLSKTELIEICGLIDGIRLFNSLHNRPIKPRRVLYICQKNNDIHFPIYLYEVSLKELLKELTTLFNSHFLNTDNRFTNEKLQKNYDVKSPLNINSNNDSRSSIGTISAETIGDDVYNSNEHYYNDIELDRQSKCRVTNRIKMSNISTIDSIDRLLIEGLTSVKIVATEQIVQLLEDESVWNLGINLKNSGQFVEAIITSSKIKRATK